MPVSRKQPGIGPSTLERLPAFVGCVTLAAGAALAAAPGRVTGPLGLVGQDAAVRAIGVSDLVLVPGLLRGSRAGRGWSAGPR